MKSLIAYASKKGATQDMAARIARGLGGADELAVKTIMKTSGDSSTIDQHAVDTFVATLCALV